MMKVLCTIAFIFLAPLSTVADAEFGNSNPAEEYLPIFKNIPTIFEYLLEALEERPEILEKNDFSVFKRSVENDESSFKREVNVNDNLKTQNENNIAKATKANKETESLATEAKSENYEVYEREITQAVSRLTSEEVEEQAIIVEQMLEEHNNKNTR